MSQSKLPDFVHHPSFVGVRVKISGRTLEHGKVQFDHAYVLGYYEGKGVLAIDTVTGKAGHFQAPGLTIQ